MLTIRGPSWTTTRGVTVVGAKVADAVGAAPADAAGAAAADAAGAAGAAGAAAVDAAGAAEIVLVTVARALHAGEVTRGAAVLMTVADEVLRAVTVAKVVTRAAVLRSRRPPRHRLGLMIIPKIQRQLPQMDPVK